MPRDAVSRTANVERTGRHKWVIPAAENVQSRAISARNRDLLAKGIQARIGSYLWEEPIGTMSLH